MFINSALTAIIKLAILCLIAIMVVGLAVVFIVVPRSVSAEDVVVPNLVGQTYGQAVALLYGAGLRVAEDIEEKSSSEVPKGHVIEQEPPASFKVKPQKPVQITLSIGDEFIPVPDTRGKSLKEVERALREAGFRRGRVAEVHSDRYPEVGVVIAQTPLSDSVHQRGAAIHLLLSLGARSRVLLMPDLRGEPVDEVRALLKSNGLEVGDEEYKSDPKIPQGAIISHVPPAGELIQVGQGVALEISGSGKSLTDRGRLVSVKYQVSDEEVMSKHVRIVVTDERRSLKVVDGYYEPGMLIERLPLRVFGEATMTVYEERIEVEKKELW